MPNGPVRRAQLIAPFGVGAMLVTKDGISLVTGGLDHWFAGADDRDEYTLQEWRLEERLRVDHFCLPPDFRKPTRGQRVPNANLTIPYLRFPQWHFCPSCRALTKVPLDRPGKRIPCLECGKNSKKRWLAQVPFVAICDAGHLQDFPWREWLHRTSTPSCEQTMRLKSLGGGSLAAQQLSCDCGVPSRSLLGITTAYPDGSTELSKRLDASGMYLCPGVRPWLGSDQGEGCGRPIRGSLRGAGNVYYSQVVSAIYLPRDSAGSSGKLLEVLAKPGPSALIRLLEEDATAERMRKRFRDELSAFSDEEVTRALEVISSTRSAATDESREEDVTDEHAFRHAEYQLLRTPRADNDLVIKPAQTSGFNTALRSLIGTVTLVERLRETRVFTGFTRVFPDTENSLARQKKMLWAAPPRGKRAWLPAYVVYGEGIFVELDEGMVQEWECRPSVLARYNALQERYSRVSADRHLRERVVSPRFVLVHTLAHLLINRLTFECGYSSASLRERLYVSQRHDTKMAALLIYTAAGDSDGTMGGLVRMGKPEYLEPVIRRALEHAQWCSADPVCLEIGGRGGQGPDALNLAACHNCALLPETACEEFNRFLDRAAVVGDGSSPRLGFF